MIAAHLAAWGVVMLTMVNRIAEIRWESLSKAFLQKDVASLQENFAFSQDDIALSRAGTIQNDTVSPKDRVAEISKNDTFGSFETDDADFFQNSTSQAFHDDLSDSFAFE